MSGETLNAERLTLNAQVKGPDLKRLGPLAAPHPFGGLTPGYNVLMIDPPWSYRNKKTGGSMKSGAAAHYATLTTDEICALPVRDLADKKGSVLFLWGTVPMLPDAFRVMEAWGYKYKTMLTWRKVMSLGMGYWWRGQCEHLLFGIRGKVPAFRMQECNFIQSKAGKHSAKPVEFRELIDRAAAKGGLMRKVELFAREAAPGWDRWGLEAPAEPNAQRLTFNAERSSVMHIKTPTEAQLGHTIATAAPMAA